MLRVTSAMKSVTNGIEKSLFQALLARICHCGKENRNKSREKREKRWTEEGSEIPEIGIFIVHRRINDPPLQTALDGACVFERRNIHQQHDGGVVKTGEYVAGHPIV